MLCLKFVLVLLKYKIVNKYAYVQVRYRRESRFGDQSTPNGVCEGGVRSAGRAGQAIQTTAALAAIARPTRRSRKVEKLPPRAGQTPGPLSRAHPDLVRPSYYSQGIGIVPPRACLSVHPVLSDSGDARSLSDASLGASSSTAWYPAKISLSTLPPLHVDILLESGDIDWCRFDTDMGGQRGDVSSGSSYGGGTAR